MLHKLLTIGCACLILVGMQVAESEAGIFGRCSRSTCPAEVYAPGLPAGSDVAVRELQQQRIVVLKEVVDFAEQAFKKAAVEYRVIHEARVALLAAQLEYAATVKDKIMIAQEGVREAEDWEQAVKKMVEGGQANRMELLKARAYVLETKITLEKVKAGK